MTFVPEYYFESFDRASPQFLLSLGIKGIILDIDNTLEPYEHDVPGENVIKWFNDLKTAGISCAFVSNNNEARVKLFNKELGFPAYWNAKKPFAANLIRAMADMATDKNNTILMGDQVFTDVFAAHNAGIPAILVPPIKDKTDALTRFKRLLEVPVLKKYNKLNKKEVD